jgi:hypothetical protein
LRVQLHGNDAGASFDERRSNRPCSSPDIDDEITRADARLIDELKRGRVS